MFEYIRKHTLAPLEVNTIRCFVKAQLPRDSDLTMTSWKFDFIELEQHTDNGLPFLPDRPQICRWIQPCWACSVCKFCSNLETFQSYLIDIVHYVLLR